MPENIAVYVHVPFCQSKCHYCDFASFAGLDSLMPGYVSAVTAEANRLRDGLLWLPQLVPPKPGDLRARTVFVGGGTPSLLSLDQVASIFQTLPPRLPDAEVSIEANPATVSLDLLLGLRELGVNRLSFGVQSFDDRLLQRLGRRHNAAEAIASYDLARQAGFENVNLDLIFGLPDQNLDHWRATLREAIALAPEHLSLYGLTIEEETVFGRLHAQGQLIVPDDDLQADMCQLAGELLDTAGYEHYEISNWAKRRAGQLLAAAHNLIYWRNEPYLGLGVAAHSSFHGWRFGNTPNVRKYIADIANDRSPVTLSEAISPELEMGETMMLGLRLAEGVIFARFVSRFGLDLRDRYRPIVAELVDLGLLAVESDRVALTPHGRMLGNEVFGRFLPQPGAVL